MHWPSDPRTDFCRLSEPPIYIVVPSTPDAAEGDFTDNDLKGGNTVQDGYDAYTLAAENSTLGFYKFSGTLNGSKA